MRVVIVSCNEIFTLLKSISIHRRKMQIIIPIKYEIKKEFIIRIQKTRRQYRSSRKKRMRSTKIVNKIIQ